MDKIALLKCTEYDVNVIENTLRKGFELLGGEEYLRKLIPKNSRVLLKPNLICAQDPGAPAITHYAVFEAVIRIVKDYCGSLCFGDSPGADDSRHAARKTGLLQVAEKYGVEFCDFKETVEVRLENALLCRSWTVAKAAYEADVIITLPKLKTHAMAYYTGAIKNQFGCVPGTRKAQWHTRMPDPHDFSRMILDLNSLVGTSFAILDGIVAMEGNGPKNGTPRQINTIIMGDSISAVDSAAVRLIGYKDPREVPMLKEAYDAKWGSVMPEEIEILGEKLEDMAVDDFKLIRGKTDFNFLGPVVTEAMRRAIAPNPKLIPDKCISCGKCHNVCPQQPKAITMKTVKGKKVPVWNMKQCIRCFCCQELCPVGAIKAKYPPIARLLGMK